MKGITTPKEAKMMWNMRVPPKVARAAKKLVSRSPTTYLLFGAVAYLETREDLGRLALA
jgi:hypothetical protein